LILQKVAGRIILYTKEGIKDIMDPITATQNAIASFFNFLSTPAGQDAAREFLSLDAEFNKKLKGLFDKLHEKVTK
jgi:hypothetical protein